MSRQLLRAFVATMTIACGACGLPGLEDPDLAIEPFLTLYEFRGETTMESPTVGGGAVANPPQNLADFGHDDRDDGWGVKLLAGDGFSGAEVQFIQLDNSGDRGTLAQDYGVLLAGDTVTTEVDLIEVRAAYTAELLDLEFDLQDEPFTVRWGLGAALVHRRLEFEAQELSGFVQRNELDDSVLPFATTRLRADWRNAGVQLDFGANPDIDFGEEFESFNSDFEVRVDYTFDVQGVTLFGAWRRATLEASGEQVGLGFSHELVLQGYTLGARLTF